MTRGRAGALALAVAAAAVIAIVASDGDEPGGQGEPGRPPAAAPGVRRAITEDGVTAHLRAIAAAAGRGGTRAAGTAGDRATTEYVAARLRAAGYRVSFQDVPFSFFEERSPPVLERLDGGRALRRGPDFRTLAFSGSGSVSGRIRGVGLAPGREAPSGCSRVAFDALRRGEIALLQRGVCTFRAKALNAQSAGAAAVLVANDGRRGNEAPPPATLQGPGVGVPVLGVSSAAAGELRTGTRVRVAVRARSEPRRTRNVIADAGPARADRVVMAGAHLDSVRDGPGVNDDGSGVAAVLAAAEALRGRALPDRAGVRFGLWGAEEVGLVGSRRYVDRLPAAERRRIAAYVNLDMVGTRGRRPALYGAPEVQRALRRQLPAAGRDRSIGNASDHAPFAGAGIQAGGIFTGLDRCYHQACDTLRNVDARLATDAARATAAALVELAGPR
jgi:aminopeptidase Y